MHYRFSSVSLLTLTLLISMSGCQSHAKATAGTDVETSSSANIEASAPLIAEADDAARGSSTRNSSQSDKVEFSEWVADFKRDARAEGINDVTLNAAFDPIQLQPRIIELDRSQPEFSRQVWDYLDSAVSDARVSQGKARLNEHRRAIEAASERYGVPGSILVAIWGIESNYGSNFGSFSTIDALATLGYDGRRPDFARSELMAALRILQRGDIDRDHMRGSWAGAMGHTQFIPSSFEAYAQDGDNDGRRDIWGSIPDVMASTANYLAKAGWRKNEPWGLEVRLPENFDYAQTELANRQSGQAWADQGVTAVNGTTLPSLENASIIAPAGAQGPAFLVGHNFRVIMRYNASTSYALAVGLLAKRITGEAGVQGKWPRAQKALSRTQVKELQALLNAKGMDVGKPDGILGPNSRQGIREYQRHLGKTPDGFATLTLLQRLRSEE
ncbi:lytic murein transglycosylase [Halomonas sp. PR-M31]|uniref:lytic murein transglycosylase n=1 Tax=Halomonas sp. PR-M31 TaxID=1471202 RepID=UPI0006503A64|nr:lytic murein transglycosylase [Halomonas sp. PR-M31]